MAYGNKEKQRNKKLQRGPRIKLSPGLEKEIAAKAALRAANKMNNLFPGSVKIDSPYQKYGNDGACGKARYLFDLYHDKNCTVEVIEELKDPRIRPVYIPEHVVEIQHFRGRKREYAC